MGTPKILADTAFIEVNRSRKELLRADGASGSGVGHRLTQGCSSRVATGALTLAAGVSLAAEIRRNAVDVRSLTGQ
jgi:hypothetical protein